MYAIKIDYRQADCKTQPAICKSIRRARGLPFDKFVPCPNREGCPMRGTICGARDESIRRTKEWLASNCNAVKPTIKDEEMGIL